MSYNCAEGSFSIKLTKILKTPPLNRGEMLYIFARMTSVRSNSKLCYIITSLKIIKTLQNFKQGSFSIKLRNICKKQPRNYGLSFPIILFGTKYSGMVDQATFVEDSL